MSYDEAYDKFRDWYLECIESGILPEEVVAEMGDMMLITSEDLIQEIHERGLP